MSSRALSPQQKSARQLAKVVPFFGGLQRKYGIPPDYQRPPGFETLLRIILEQQVSLASAEAVFKKLNAAVMPLTAAEFLTVSDEKLLGFGFSRQKSGYCRGLAEALVKGTFDFSELSELSDEKAMEYLTQLKGIGTWSAEVYLLMAEQRLDLFPSKDLALQVSLQEQQGLETRPSSQLLEQISIEWKPHRSAAAKWLWYAYLTDRGKAEKEPPN